VPTKWKRHLRRASAVAGVGGTLGFILVWCIGAELLKPATGPVEMPAAFKGTEVNFESGSGSVLKGNFIARPDGKGIVILMHGVRGNRRAMVGHAEFLLACGYSVLLFDFQAHGESPGTKITNGYLESMDAAAAVKFAKQRAHGEKIAILGSSLGGAAALLADPPLQVDAMILEMVYPDIERAVKNRIAIVLGDWARVFSPALTWQLKRRVGVGADWFSPERAIAKTACPKLVIAGKRDRHTTLADSKSLFAAAREPKEFWIVENAAHEDVHGVVGKDYEDRVVAFLERSFAAASISARK